jgi:hypothetical protein
VASIAALSLAAAYLEGAFVGAPATRLILFVVSSRAVLALGALAGLL